MLKFCIFFRDAWVEKNLISSLHMSESSSLDPNASLRSAGSAGSAGPVAPQRLLVYPVADGCPRFAQRLAEVTDHVFDGVPRWQTGMVSRDRAADQAAKAYLAVSDMRRLVESEGRGEGLLRTVESAIRSIRGLTGKFHHLHTSV